MFGFLQTNCGNFKKQQKHLQLMKKNLIFFSVGGKFATELFICLLFQRRRGHKRRLFPPLCACLPPLHLNVGWWTLPRRGARAFWELSTRHASRFELELDRRNAARGNAGSRLPPSIHGAQVGVSSDYHKTQPASD